MVRVSNSVIGTLNILTLLLSVPIIGGGAWLWTRSAPSECERFLGGPLLAVGLFLLVVSLLGLAGACCRVSLLLWVYLLVTFLLILFLFCFTVFAFVVTNKGAGEIASGRGFREYRLGDYSHWLRRRVETRDNWGRIRSCLLQGNLCKGFTDHDRLSPIQSGCCEPPTACNFTRRDGEAAWDKPVDSATASNISDCNMWQNNAEKLCFDCDSCKAGLLATVKHDWKKVAIVNVVVLIFLVIVYSVGCCAFRNNRRENSSYRWKGYA